MIGTLDPSARYAILTNKERLALLTCKVGDSVVINDKERTNSNGHVGLVQYIGPIINKNVVEDEDQNNQTWAERLGQQKDRKVVKQKLYAGTWFGLEIISVRTIS